LKNRHLTQFFYALLNIFVKPLFFLLFFFVICFSFSIAFALLFILMLELFILKLEKSLFLKLIIYFKN